MSGRCGCQGGFRIVEGEGIDITGPGTVANPAKISIENPLTGPACDNVVRCVGEHCGAGMRYDPVSKRIIAAISGDSGNNLSYGSDNGLFASGGGGGGGDSGYTTVAGLAAQTFPIVGGSYGAGIAQWPEGPIDTYKAALDTELQLIHVPVRRSAEYYCVAHHFRNLEFYNARFGGNTNTMMDLKMYRHLRFTPGTEQDEDPNTPTTAGYWGANYPTSRGAVMLSDLFSLVNRRSVLYLECKDIGAGSNDTPAPRDTLNVLSFLVRRFGATKSVIVGSEFPLTATHEDIVSIAEGLNICRDAGIAIAAHLTSETMVDQITPKNLTDNGFTWVFISYGVADRTPEKVKAYKDAGLNVMLFSGHRQWHYDLVKDTTKFGSGGLKGILCSDPIYCAGVTSSYRYRLRRASWTWGTADYGRHSNWSASGLEYQHVKYRGYIRQGEGQQLSLDGDLYSPGDNPTFRQSAYMVLMGEQCPMPLNPATGKMDNYSIDVGFVWDDMLSDRGRWMSVWWGNPQDRSLTEWRLASEYTRGYQLQLNQNGQFVLQRYDGIPWPGGDAAPHQYALVWDSPWVNQIQPNVEYRIRVRVRPDRIICGPLGQLEGGPNTRTFGKDVGGDMWRGGYVYLGRHTWSNNDTTRCRFVDLHIQTGTD